MERQRKRKTKTENRQTRNLKDRLSNKDKSLSEAHKYKCRLLCLGKQNTYSLAEHQICILEYGIQSEKT